MPGGNRTGPTGQGPMTGRAAGYCGGYNAPGYMNSGPRRGMGFGRGRGFGRGLAGVFGRGFAQNQNFSQPAQLTKEEQKKILQEDLKDLETEKQEIENTLKQLDQ